MSLSGSEQESGGCNEDEYWLIGAPDAPWGRRLVKPCGDGASAVQRVEVGPNRLSHTSIESTSSGDVEQTKVYRLYPLVVLEEAIASSGPASGAQEHFRWSWEAFSGVLEREPPLCRQPSSASHRAMVIPVVPHDAALGGQRWKKTELHNCGTRLNTELKKWGALEQAHAPSAPDDVTMTLLAGSKRRLFVELVGAVERGDRITIQHSSWAPPADLCEDAAAPPRSESTTARLFPSKADAVVHDDDDLEIESVIFSRGMRLAVTLPPGTKRVGVSFSRADSPAGSSALSTLADPTNSAAALGTFHEVPADTCVWQKPTLFRRFAQPFSGNTDLKVAVPPRQPHEDQLSWADVGRPGEARVAFAANGKWYALVTDGGVLLGDSSNYRPLSFLPMKGVTGSAIVFDPPSEHLVVASSSGAYVLDILKDERGPFLAPSRAQLVGIEKAGANDGFVFDRTGRFLAAVSHHGLTVLDFRQRRPLFDLFAHFSSSPFAFGFQRDTLFWAQPTTAPCHCDSYGGTDALVASWRLGTRTVEILRPQGDMQHPGMFRMGRITARGGTWDARTGRRLRSAPSQLASRIIDVFKFRTRPGWLAEWRVDQGPHAVELGVVRSSGSYRRLQGFEQTVMNPSVRPQDDEIVFTESYPSPSLQVLDIASGTLRSVELPDRYCTEGSRVVPDERCQGAEMRPAWTPPEFLKASYNPIQLTAPFPEPIEEPTEEPIERGTSKEPRSPRNHEKKPTRSGPGPDAPPLPGLVPRR